MNTGRIYATQQKIMIAQKRVVGFIKILEFAIRP